MKLIGYYSLLHVSNIYWLVYIIPNILTKYVTITAAITKTIVVYTIFSNFDTTVDFPLDYFLP